MKAVLFTPNLYVNAFMALSAGAACLENAADGMSGPVTQEYADDLRKKAHSLRDLRNFINAISDAGGTVAVVRKVPDIPDQPLELVA